MKKARILLFVCIAMAFASCGKDDTGNYGGGANGSYAPESLSGRTILFSDSNLGRVSFSGSTCTPSLTSGGNLISSSYTYTRTSATEAQLEYRYRYSYNFATSGIDYCNMTITLKLHFDDSDGGLASGKRKWTWDKNTNTGGNYSTADSFTIF